MRLRRSTAPRPPPRQRPLLEELEPRILFSADAAAGLLDANQLDVPAQVRLLEPVPVAPEPSAGAEAVQQTRHEIVFVDTRVADYQVLVDDLLSQNNDSRQIEVFVLDPNQDGIEQISQVLAQRDDIDALHLISHGADGEVQLGDTYLNFDSLLQQAEQIQRWGDALTADADLLIYGCDVAQQADGKALVDALSRLTGADVAASTDLTGNAALGGDWTLEFQNGQIDTHVLIDAATQQNWDGVLAITANGTASSAQSANVGTTANQLTWSHTVAAGSNRVLFVELSIDGVGANATSVTYNGAALTKVGRTAGNHAVEIWALINPTVGTASVVATFAGSTAVAGGASTFNGVDQSTPYGAYSGATSQTSGDSTTASVTLSSATGDLVLDVQYWKNTGANIVGSGQSSLWSQLITSSMLGGSTTEAGAASVTMTGTSGTASQWEIGAVSIKAATNSAPVVTATGSALAYTENAAATAVDSGLTVSDVDNTNLSSATVTISANYANGQDTLAFTNQSGITGSWNASTGVLTLSGSATVANYQAALRSVTYYNSSDNPSTATRTVSFVVNDGTANSTAASRTITVTASNDPPVVTTTGSALAYTENAVATAVDGGLTVSDVDNTSLSSATVTISANYANGQDTLAFTNQSGITGSWNASTGVLTLSGSATVANYQAALRSVTYANSSDNPSTATRTVSFVVDDGTLSSTAATRSITVAAVNDPPVFTSSTGTLPYSEGSGPYLIGSVATITDVDSADFNGGQLTIQITVNALAEDRLTIRDQGTGAGQVGVSGSNITFGGVTVGTFNGPVTGGTALIVTFNANSSPAIAQAVVRNVTYENTSEDPSTAIRTIVGYVSDGDGGTSATLASYIAPSKVNDAPVVSAVEGTALAYSENAPPTAVTSTLTLSDVDNTNLTGATVWISANYASGQDVLAFADQNGITGSWASGTGTLTLSGTASVAQYQAALRSITYQNTSDAPSTAPRTVSFTVTDGTTPSGAATRDVAATAVNDAPVITSATLTVSEGQTVTLAGADFGITDPDGASFSYTVSDISGGYFQLSSAAATPITSFTSADLAGGLVQFVDDGNEVAPGFSVTVNDGTDDSNTLAATINYTSVNDAPTASNDAYAIDEDSSLTVTWWNSAWTRRQQLTFDNLAQAETLTDFPALIVLNSSNIDYTQTQDDGSDLRFFASDGTPLAYEIEQWNEGGDSSVWVRVPLITGNSSSDSIWMYYGNATAEAGADPTAVWDGNFVGVWHLNEDQAGTGMAGVYQDSTAYGNDGIDRVAATGKEGQITDGQQLGANDWIEVDHDASLDLKGSMTISFWIKPTAPLVNFDRVVEKGLWGYNNSYYFGGGNGTNDLTFYLNGQEVIDTADNVLTVGVWQHAALSYTSNGDGTGTARMYLDGVEIASGTYSGGAVVGNNGRLAIGHDNSSYDYEGYVDEVQISNTDRSADWIAAQYQATKNQFGAEFVEFGGEQTVPVVSGVLGNDTDVDGDALRTTLVTGPTHGSLTLNADGTFSYTPNANWNGIDSFTYQANDGTVDSNVATVSITVNPLNDAPVRTAGTVSDLTVLEDAGATSLGLAGLSYGPGGGSDESGQTLSYTVTAVPAASLGNITLADGVTVVSANTSYSLAELQGMKFVATADANGGPASFSWKAQDDGGTANGGIDTLSESLTISVTALNDAPTVANPISDQAATEDSAFSFQLASNTFADVDIGDSLTYTANGVPTWLSCDAATRTFSGTPANGDVGTVSITVRATDTSGAWVEDDFDITVVNTNDAPTAADNTVSTAEDTTYTFSAADFNFSDIDGDALASVKITTLESVGALQLAGSDVSLNQVITRTQIDAGSLKFVPVSNANGAGYDSFAFSVNDGALDSAASYTMTIDVTPKPSLWLTTTGASAAPSGTPGLTSWSAGALLQVSDPNLNLEPGTTSGTFSLVGNFSAMAADGAATISGMHYVSTDITVGTSPGFQLRAGDLLVSFTATETLTSANSITANADNMLVFRPTNAGDYSAGSWYRLLENPIGQGFGDFTLVEKDTAIGDFTVTAGNFLMSADGGRDILYVQVTGTGLGTTSASKSVLIQGSDISLGASSNGVNALELVETTMTIGGRTLTAGQILIGLQSSDAAVGSGGSVAVSEYDIAVLTVTQTELGGTGVTQASASLMFQGTDVGLDTTSASPSGTKEAIGAFTFRTPAQGNGAPVITSDGGGANASVSAAENTVAVTTVGATDPNGDALTYTISGGADAARFVINGSTGALSLVAAPNYESPADVGLDNVYDVIVQVADGKGGVDSQAIAVTVFNVNEAPTGTNKTVTTNEDTAYSLTKADFGFSDAADSPANNLLAVQVTTLPGAGTLTLSGVAVTAGQYVSAANIGSGLLKFTPAADANGSGYASFTFQVQDDGGTANGGVDLDPTPNTITIAVTAVNDAPVVTTTAGSMNYTENAGAKVIDGGLMIADVDSANLTGATVIISVAYVNGEDVLGFVDQGGITGNWDAGTGTLTLSGTASVAAYEAALRTVSYTNNSENPSIAVRTVSFTVTDGAAPSALATRQVQVVSVDDPPQTNDASASGAEDATSVAITLTGSDVDDGVNHFRLSSLPSNGQLYLDAGLTTLAATGTDYAATGQALTLYFVPDTDWNGSTSFQFVARDVAGLMDATPATATITVNAVNDTPTVANPISDQAATEDSAFSFQFAANTFADVDVGDSFTYTASGVPGWLSFDAATRTFSGTPVNADVGTVTITVRAADTSGAWVEDDFDIVVGNTNDAPTVANPIADQTATEDVPFSLTIDAATFNDVDVGDSVTYTASGVPGWLTFDAATLSFSGTPANADVGTVTITVRATDGSGAWVEDAFDIVVGNTNDAPTVANPISDQAATEDSAFSFQFAANTFADVDVGDSLTYTASAVPGWLSFDAAMRTFSGTPTNSDVGTVTITVRATDTSGAWVEDGFDLVVANTNDTPTVANPISDQSATEDSTFSFQFASNTFADVDIGDSLTYTVNGVPGWLSFDAATRTFSGTPANADVGTVTITVRATDTSGAWVEDDFDITVVNTNDAPTAADNTVSTVEDNAYTFSAADFNFSDIDGDALASVKITTLESVGALQLAGSDVSLNQVITRTQIDAGSLKFVPVSNANGAGYDSFAFSVNDGTLDSAASYTMTIDVTAANDPPVMTAAWMSLRLGETVVLSTANISAQDVDDAMSSLVFSVSGLTGGRFELVAQPGQAISSFTYGELYAGSVRFVQDGSTAVPAFKISASDGKAGSAALAAQVTFDVSTAVGGEYPGGAGASSDGGDVGNNSAGSNIDDTGPDTVVPAVTNPSTEAPPSTSQNGGTGIASALESGAVERQVLARSPAPMASVQVPPPARIVLVDVSSRRAEIDISPGMALDEYMLRLVSLKLAAAEHGGTGRELSVSGTGMDQTSRDEAAAHELSIQTAQVLGISLTVGTVWWALRVSGLVGGLLASLPAWRQLDLLMILPDDGERTLRWGDNDDKEALREEVAVSELLVVADQELRR